VSVVMEAKNRDDDDIRVCERGRPIELSMPFLVKCATTKRTAVSQVSAFS
jgi:hypothetical protein